MTNRREAHGIRSKGNSKRAIEPRARSIARVSLAVAPTRGSCDCEPIKSLNPKKPKP